LAGFATDTRNRKQFPVKLEKQIMKKYTRASRLKPHHVRAPHIYGRGGPQNDSLNDYQDYVDFNVRRKSFNPRNAMRPKQDITCQQGLSPLHPFSINNP
jgi:hypothetical protein